MSRIEEPVRLAVIGLGLIGTKHAELINKHSRCSLVGIADIDSSRRTAAEAFDAPFYDNIEAMLERESPEGVIISTPTQYHTAVAEICTRRSVHLFIEKPIAESLNGAKHIVKIADDAGIQILVGHHRRYSPFIQETRALVQGGTLGKLVGVSVLWALTKPDDYYKMAWRCASPGGGPAFINLIHDLDSLRFICGEIRQVYAHSSAAVRKLAVEDSLSITFVFENGALGSVLASDATPAPWSYEATSAENPYYFHTDENCYHFLGTLASLSFPQMELWHYVDEKRRGWQHPMKKSRIDVTPKDPLESQLDHFCQVIRGEEKPLVDGRDGTRSLAVVLAILESIELQAPIEVTDCFAPT